MFGVRDVFVCEPCQEIKPVGVIECAQVSPSERARCRAHVGETACPLFMRIAPSALSSAAWGPR